MKVLIAGGAGFMGSALARLLQSSGHEVWILTRHKPRRPRELQWDGRSVNGWSECISEMDAVVNTTGYGLEHWPWSADRKRKFIQSRVLPALALSAAIQASQRRPAVFVQISGINYYGARGAGVADESSPAARDYLAELTVQWEGVTRKIERLGVRRVVARSAVVLAAHGGLFPLMALPVRMGLGGPLGNGRQAVPWIHVEDEVRALQFLVENKDAAGPFNLIAPDTTSNAQFMCAIARAVRRPCWFRTPGFLLRAALGEMSTLVLDGRYSQPKRLTELGFSFNYPNIDAALQNLFGGP
ncbi:MAG: TIGR01777 family oxidoreductase [Anaerolineales bacterium]